MKLELRVESLILLEDGKIYVSTSMIGHGGGLSFTVDGPCSDYNLGDLLIVTVDKRASDELVEASVLEETLQTLKRSLTSARYEALMAELGDV